MSRRVVTAWRLRDGVPVYLGPNQVWVKKLHEASPFDPEAAEEALKWARSKALECTVVDPYTMEVSTEGQPMGRRVRETIRSAGPTVRPDLAHVLLED